MFEDITNNLQNAGGAIAGGFSRSVGAAANFFGQFFDLDAPDYEAIVRMPRARVLSSRARIKLIIPASVQSSKSGQEFDIGEVDGITFTKNFNVVKRWKPYGSKFEKVLIEDNGWDIQWSGGKVDWALAYMVFAQEQALAGNDDSNFPGGSNTFDDLSSLYKAPVFEISSTIKHYDGSIENYIYRDVQILTFGQEVSGENGQITESITAFSTRRVIGPGLKDDETSNINDSIANIISNMITSNRS